MKKPRIRKAMSERRGVASLQTLSTITIPAGTIIRSIGKDKFACKLGFGGGAAAEVILTVTPSDNLDGTFLKRVVAS